MAAAMKEAPEEKVICVVGLAILSFLIGCLASRLLQIRVAGQHLWSEEWLATAYWSGLVYALVGIPANLIAIRVIGALASRRGSSPQRTPLLLYVTILACLGTIPTWAVTILWGGWFFRKPEDLVRWLLLPLGRLLYALFAISGVCFICGYWWCFIRTSTRKENGTIRTDC